MYTFFCFVTETTASLEDVISGKFHQESGVGGITAALEEAEDVEREIRYRNFIDRAIAVDEEDRYVWLICKFLWAHFYL